MYRTREEVKNWLEKMYITSYMINEDLTVDVEKSVDISNKELKEIPIKFGIINGNFNCNHNKLINLEGCPEIINGVFDCSNNKLISLKDGPKEVNGDFDCYNNKLTSLEGCPKIIEGSLSCFLNKLTNLEGCSEVVKGVFSCAYNRLTSLEGCPVIVNRSFNCSNNKLTSLKDFPQKINGKYINFKINSIKEEELVNFNCDITNVIEIYSDFNKDRNVKEFLEKVKFYKNIKEESELLKELSINDNNVKLNKKL